MIAAINNKSQNEIWCSLLLAHSSLTLEGQPDGLAEHFHVLDVFVRGATQQSTRSARYLQQYESARFVYLNKCLVETSVLLKNTHVLFKQDGVKI